MADDLNTGQKSWQTRGMSLADRLEFRTIRIPELTCWLWDGHHDKDGYASICVDGRTRHAYAVYYELKFGIVPAGKVLDHKCKNRGCVNPLHLEPVTTRENVVVRSEVSFVGINARKSTCKHGHSDWKVYPNRAKQQRVCRVCQRGEWERRHRKVAEQRRVAKEALNGAR